MNRYRSAVYVVLMLGIFFLLSSFARATGLCRYMIVVPDESYEAAVAPLRAWKEQIGFSTCIARLDLDIDPAYSDEPDEAARIWKYLRQAAAEQGIDYVLLAGDVDVLPQRVLYPDGSPGAGLSFGSDFYYANLDQPDWDVDNDNRWGEWQQDQLS